MPIRRLLASSLALAVLAGGLAACRPGQTPGSQAKADFDTARFQQIVDANFGGVGSCVMIAETATGRVAYQYGNYDRCRTPLPPCSTFKIPNSLIGLDAGLVTPTTVFKWDGSPQRVSAWERDADMRTAFKQSIVWWYQRLARAAGKPLYEERLKAYDYGSEKPEGPIDRFWLGPAAGGGLTISTTQQIDFLGRFYRNELPVKPQSAAFVRELMVDETRGEGAGRAVISGKTGTCSSDAAEGRQVGWWVGRLQSGPRDYLFAVSLEGANDASLPGAELASRVKSAFTAVGLLPSA